MHVLGGFSKVGSSRPWVEEPQQGSNSLVRKPLLLILMDGQRKITMTLIQTVSAFVGINKGHGLLSLELRP